MCVCVGGGLIKNVGTGGALQKSWHLYQLEGQNEDNFNNKVFLKKWPQNEDNLKNEGYLEIGLTLKYRQPQSSKTKKWGQTEKWRWPQERWHQKWRQSKRLKQTEKWRWLRKWRQPKSWWQP